MKTKNWLIISLVVLTIAILCWLKYRGDVTARPPETWVSVKAVTEVSLPSEVQAIGALAARSVEITPEVAGHVEKILFKDGAYVQQGTPLVQFNDATYRTQADSAKAKLIFSESKYKRMQLLAKKSFVAQLTMDELLADLKGKRAEAKASDVLLSKMKLTAPFAGEVSKSKVSLGDYVNVGMSVVTLTDTKHLRIEYNIPEKYLSHLKLGQPVTVTTAAYPGKTFQGVVAYISPTINSDNRSIALYADVPNENQLLKAGMFANVVQSLGNEERVLILPSRSLIPGIDGEQVYKVVEGKAYSVMVTIGKRTDKEVQVVQGLTAGDVIITDGQLKVKNGMPVKFTT
jgi:membrane fusion protein, multidrug efflux system